MTDCNYCKQSPRSLQPGCCTETRIFPAASRGSADHDQAVHLLSPSAAGTGDQEPGSPGLALLPFAPCQGGAARPRRGGAAAEGGRGRDGRCPGARTPAQPHTHPAAPALPALGRNKLPPTNWDTKH